MGWLNLVSLVGLLVFAGAAWICSNHRRVVNWCVVFWGLGIQLTLGLLLFRFTPGRALLLVVNDWVVALLAHARRGTEFVFGSLAIPAGEPGSHGFILAFQGLTTAVFFAALVGLLHRFGVLPWLVRQFAKGFSRTMRVSGAEALCVSSNLFVGIESMLTIKPYLRDMTRSELCTVLTAGMATIASTVLGLYALILHAAFPAIAGHLVSASLLSLPAAFVCAKLLCPEVEKPTTLGTAVEAHQAPSTNWLEALAASSLSGLHLAFGIAALLIAGISLLSLLDALVGTAGSWVGLSALSVESILGWVFYPAAVLMGVPLGDAGSVSELLGLRFVATEIPAYQALAVASGEGGLSPRAVVIAAYALCGFAHLPSLGIFIGGMVALEGSISGKLGQVGMRALLAATLACLMTGAIAGIFYTGGEAELIQTVGR